MKFSFSADIQHNLIQIFSVQVKKPTLIHSSFRSDINVNKYLEKMGDKELKSYIQNKPELYILASI